MKIFVPKQVKKDYSENALYNRIRESFKNEAWYHEDEEDYVLPKCPRKQDITDKEFQQVANVIYQTASEAVGMDEEEVDANEHNLDEWIVEYLGK